MNSLETPGAMQELESRLRLLESGDAHQWGSMAAHEALVHMREAFRAGRGQRAVRRVSMPLPPRVLKFLALRVPVRWAKGVQTVPELKVGAPGMPPLADFAADRSAAVDELRRFAAPGATLGDHPFFGKMTRSDWMRWGWLHADHHLRQFGR